MRKKEVKEVIIIIVITLLLILIIYLLFLAFTKATGIAGGSSGLFSLFSFFRPSPSLAVSTLAVTQCSDHIDNDKDGFCDYKTTSAYCSDGSIAGDLGCSGSTDTTEYLGCTPTTEVCDGKDNNCDNLIDNGGNCAINYYCDLDKDGYRSLAASGGCIKSGGCKIPTGCRTLKGNDCNDFNKLIHPGFVEEDCVGDGKDNDCNGIIDDCFNKTCKELFPGTNVKTGDRINVIIAGINYPTKTSFIDDSKEAVDYYGSVYSPYTFKGLLELPIYKDNKNKFNFWYIDKIFTNSPNKSGSQPELCGNPEILKHCSGLANVYRSYFCNVSFGSAGYLGGTSFISTYGTTNQLAVAGIFGHEFQHQFPQLADEYYYTSGGSDKPYRPNCANTLTDAQTWWGSLNGKTGSDNLTIGYYAGCSYVPNNYRPTTTSLMKDTLTPKFGLVNEREITSDLSGYTGLASTILAGAMQITLEGNPEDLSSYVVTDITSVKLSNAEKIKNAPFTINIKAGSRAFKQNFDVYDYYITENFDSSEISGEFKKLGKEQIILIVPLGASRLDTKTRTIDLPEQANVPFSIEIVNNDVVVRSFSAEEARGKIS